MPYSVEAVRRHWTLDPAVTFLNHGSYGASPRPVLEAQTRWRERLEAEPVRFFAREFQPSLDAARDQLGRFVGSRPEDLVFVPNATTGVNTVLRSLDLARGDELLTTDHVYNACRNALLAVAQRSGARAVFAPVPFPLRHPDEVVEAVLAQVTPRTRLLLLDHVTSPTGLIFPVKRLVNEMAERGIDTLVDGAHGPGMLPIDVTELGAAYYTGNCHKWLCAPKGAALLHVRRDRHARVRPLVTSHGVRATRASGSRFHAEFDWVGTDDPTAYLCVPEAIRFLGSLLPGGWAGLMAHNRETALLERSRLAERLGVPIPAPDSMIGSLATVPLPDTPEPDAPPTAYGDPLQTALVETHRIQVPVVLWPAPPRRFVRISCQIYNDPSQYDLLATALRAELAAGR